MSLISNKKLIKRIQELENRLFKVECGIETLLPTNNSHVSYKHYPVNKVVEFIVNFLQLEICEKSLQKKDK